MTSDERALSNRRATSSPVSRDTRLRVGGPDAITLTVCESCSRTDRWQSLKKRHFAQGGLCHGPIKAITYVRDGVA